MLRSIIFGSAILASSMVLAAEPSLCIKDADTSFCIEYDAPVRIVPYREPKSGSHVVTEHWMAPPANCNRMLTSSPPQVPPECRNLIAK